MDCGPLFVNSRGRRKTTIRVQIHQCLQDSCYKQAMPAERFSRYRKLFLIIHVQHMVKHVQISWLPPPPLPHYLQVKRKIVIFHFPEEYNQQLCMVITTSSLLPLRAGSHMSQVLSSKSLEVDPCNLNR